MEKKEMDNMYFCRKIHPSHFIDNLFFMKIGEIIMYLTFYWDQNILMIRK